MKVGDLGEFGLIAALEQIVRAGGADLLAGEALLCGIGDDAAAWLSHRPLQLCTTDMLVDGIHFTTDGIVWRDLGWKSLAVNISDIAAMGGHPTCAVISLGLPAGFEYEQIAELYHGLVEAARRFDMAIAGGNVTEAPVLTVSPAVMGEADPSRLMTRSAAEPGDVIAVTGSLGASAAGLRMKSARVELDPEVAAALSRAHNRPVPRVEAGLQLATAGVRCAIDISDGLFADLAHICQTSGVRGRIRLEAVPVDSLARVAFPAEAVDLALAGGEDYELLVIAPEEIIRQAGGQLAPLPLTVIGVVEEGEGSVVVMDEHGREREKGHGGWEHFGLRSGERRG